MLTSKIVYRRPHCQGLLLYSLHATALSLKMTMRVSYAMLLCPGWIRSVWSRDDYHEVVVCGLNDGLVENLLAFETIVLKG